MVLFRQVRPRDRIKIPGPATIVVVGGRAAIEIHHAPGVKVEHQRPAVVAKRKRGK